PTVNALQGTITGAFNAFVAKLNPSGSQLIYSTYFGGSVGEYGSSIAVNSTGEVFVGGVTSSPNFPTKNPVQPSFGGNLADAFVMKLNAAGSTLVFSTYLGGSGDDRGYRLVLDSSSNVYVVGQTTSSNFPVASALQPAMGGGADAFITKFGSTGSVMFSTYLGGTGIDGATGVAVDA